jgi:hypothetical protein
MVKWSHDGGREQGRVHECYVVWRCQECQKEKEIYRRPWTWFWLTACYPDLMDRVVVPRWWLGSIGAVGRDYYNEITFTVIPFNALLDAAVRVWRWCKYRRPNKLEQDLERSYRRGVVDGQGNTRVQIEVAVKEALREEREAVDYAE